MRQGRDAIQQNRWLLLLWGILNLSQGILFWLYDLPREPFWYGLAVSTFFLGVVLTVSVLRLRKKEKELEIARRALPDERTELPSPENGAEETYQEMLRTLTEALAEVVRQAEEERKDRTDYYTAWVHQIKTPIAVMKLKLAEDTPENRALRHELFRIEQYVTMVLQYVRLGSSSTDLLIRTYALDDILRACIRKYAPQFIEKKISVEFLPTERSVVTDEKWFSCIVEQFLSNAVKYTSSGVVSVFVEDHRLKISDTGIGIATEDLPRIFEQGFTGRNGRIDPSSSGLGLYLAGKAARLLNLTLQAESIVGAGSTFSVSLPKENE